MGGGGDHGHHGDAGDFRTKVWTMTGGPNCRPKHWKRNTAIAMAGVFLICIPIAMKSAELEVTPLSLSLGTYVNVTFLSICICVHALHIYLVEHFGRFTADGPICFAEVEMIRCLILGKRFASLLDLGFGICNFSYRK